MKQLCEVNWWDPRLTFMAEKDVFWARRNLPAEEMRYTKFALEYKETPPSGKYFCCTFVAHQAETREDVEARLRASPSSFYSCHVEVVAVVDDPLEYLARS